MVSKDFGHDDYGSVLDDKFRKRVWMALCYPDNDEMNSWWTDVLPGLDLDYVGRIHDQEGKPHHHIVFLFKEAKTVSSCAKNTQYLERWLRPWDSKIKAMRYLCHCDNPEKFQYTPDLLYGPLFDEAFRRCSKSSQESEAKTVSDLISILDSIEGYISFTDFSRIAVDKGYWSVFRRMGALAGRFIDEHNSRCVKRDSQFAVLADFDRFKDYVNSGKSKEIPFDQYCSMLKKNNFPDTRNS